MKQIHKIYMPIALAMSLAACNDIDSEERFIELPPIMGDRVVLVEDYTGQGCPNCPEAHRVLEQLSEQYPGKIITVSIHAGEFAIPTSETRYVGLSPDFADGMKTDRGVTQYPTAVIDGFFNEGKPATWAANVRDALMLPALCNIEMTNFLFDPTTRRISFTVSATPDKSVAGLMGVWLLENGITARQYNVNNDHKWDRNYVHDNVLRNYLTESPWGDPVTLTRYEAIERSFTTELDSSWNHENISVVVFVTDAATGEYLQSVRTYMNETTSE